MTENKKKPTKWDLKKAAKLIGLDLNPEVEKTFEDLVSKESTADEAVPVLPVGHKSNVAFSVARKDGAFAIYKVVYDMEEVEIVGLYDLETRALMERGKLEAEVRAEELKKR